MSITPQTQSSDIRAAKRVNLDSYAELDVENRLLKARVLNISVTGMGLLCETELATNSLIHTQLALDFHHQTTRLQLEGNVVHATPVHNQFLIGVEFCNISAYRQTVIQQYVDVHG